MARRCANGPMQVVSGPIGRNRLHFEAPAADRLKVLNKLLDGLDGKLTSSKWAKLSKCSQDTALRNIVDLIDKELLAKDPGGGRSTSYSLVEH